MTYEVLKNGEDVVHRFKFNDISDFKKACLSEGCRDFDGTEWRGYMDKKMALNACDVGVKDGIGDAQKLISKLDDSGIEPVKNKWATSIAGAFPNVPAYLAGENECMFNLESDADMTAPIKMFVGVTSSTGISDDDLKIRGAAILALTMKLAEVRPVELWVYLDLDYEYKNNLANLLMVRVNTTPMDLSVSNFMMVSQGFARGVGMNYLKHKQHYHGGWAFIDKVTESRTERLKFALEASENDFVVPSAFNGDLIIKDPMGWVTKKLAEASQQH